MNKKIICPILITMISIILVYLWSHNNKRYTYIERRRSMCDNINNCPKCQYYNDCYGPDNVEL